jgi:hypothetical protein
MTLGLGLDTDYPGFARDRKHEPSRSKSSSARNAAPG